MRDLLIQQLKGINSKEDFADLAIQIFRYQANHCEVYNEYLSLLGCRVNDIQSVDQIPCLPIEVFKKRRVCSSGDVDIEFTSSGTTGDAVSTHFVKDINIYRWSFLKSFNLHYGNPEDYVILGLLPSYLERKGSSLIFMVDELIRLSKSEMSGFYLNNHTDLINILEKLKAAKQKVLLIGVSFALIDLAEIYQSKFPELIVMETGGMKGRRKELVRSELHEILQEAFGVNAIHSEYGMTELLSQAYSHGNGLFHCPPWMDVFIREIDDPFSMSKESATGGVNVIDLANIDSCSFIATSDLGKKHGGGFEVLGRFDNSDVRGCNLLIN
ncbi:MAG: acyl transferase [Cryomorphaceae bacterium]|nr:acyl transferase [Cryomorphaceae bacterium]